MENIKSMCNIIAILVTLPVGEVPKGMGVVGEVPKGMGVAKRGRG